MAGIGKSGNRKLRNCTIPVIQIRNLKSQIKPRSLPVGFEFLDFGSELQESSNFEVSDFTILHSVEISSLSLRFIR